MLIFLLQLLVFKFRVLLVWFYNTNLVSNVKRSKQIKGIWKQGAEESIWK
jgi:hypothetical protein